MFDRFWRLGKWYDVVVDDRLPTQSGKLQYVVTTGGSDVYAVPQHYTYAGTYNDYWVPFLEKAFAKVFGSYKALDGGFAETAMVAMSGCVPEVYYDFPNDSPKFDILLEVRLTIICPYGKRTDILVSIALTFTGSQTIIIASGDNSRLL